MLWLTEFIHHRKAMKNKHAQALAKLSHESMTKEQRIARAKKASAAATVARKAKSMKRRKSIKKHD